MISEIDLRILKIVLEELVDKNIKGISEKDLNDLYDQFHEYDFKKMFSEMH